MDQRTRIAITKTRNYAIDPEILSIGQYGAFLRVCSYCNTMYRRPGDSADDQILLLIVAEARWSHFVAEVTQGVLARSPIDSAGERHGDAALHDRAARDFTAEVELMARRPLRVGFDHFSLRQGRVNVDLRMFALQTLCDLPRFPPCSSANPIRGTASGPR